MRLKILTWNIWFDSTDFGSICNFLENNPADIIGLQEVSDDPKLDIISFMTKLGYNHVFTQAATANIHGKKYGNAIFSKYTLNHKRDYILSTEKSRNALSADVIVGDAVLHVFSTHLIHDHQQSSDLQQEQIESLIKVLPKEKTIVLGDFNAAPGSRTIASMEAIMNNNDSADNPTWSLDPGGCETCNPKGVEVRLDYIFTSKDIKLLNSQVMSKARGSDHLPVLIEIEI